MGRSSGDRDCSGFFMASRSRRPTTTRRVTLARQQRRGLCQAAGRRRSNKSRSSAGRRRRPAPGSHSRRLCRAIRHCRDRPGSSSRESRLKRTRVSTRRWRRAPLGVISGKPVYTRCARPESSRRQSSASSRISHLGRMRRPTQTTVSAASTSEGPIFVAPDRHRRGDGCLFGAETLRQGARRFVALRRLFDIGGDHRVGLDADLRQQGQTAWRSRRQDEAWSRRSLAHATSLMVEASPEAYLNR